MSTYKLHSWYDDEKGEEDQEKMTANAENKKRRRAKLKWTEFNSYFKCVCGGGGLFGIVSLACLRYMLYVFAEQAMNEHNQKDMLTYVKKSLHTCMDAWHI